MRNPSQLCCCQYFLLPKYQLSAKNCTSVKQKATKYESCWQYRILLEYDLRRTSNPNKIQKNIMSIFGKGKKRLDLINIWGLDQLHYPKLGMVALNEYFLEVETVSRVYYLLFILNYLGTTKRGLFQPSLIQIRFTAYGFLVQQIIVSRTGDYNYCTCHSDIFFFQMHRVMNTDVMWQAFFRVLYLLKGKRWS